MQKDFKNILDLTLEMTHLVLENNPILNESFSVLIDFKEIDWFLKLSNINKENVLKRLKWRYKYAYIGNECLFQNSSCISKVNTKTNTIYYNTNEPHKLCTDLLFLYEEGIIQIDKKYVIKLNCLKYNPLDFGYYATILLYFFKKVYDTTEFRKKYPEKSIKGMKKKFLKRKLLRYYNFGKSIDMAQEIKK